MTNRVKGILEDKFVIDCYGNVGVYNHCFGNEIGTLQGWYGSQSREIRKESEEAYKMARDFLKNFIIDTRNFLAAIKKEDIIRLEDGTWTPVSPFPTDEEYPCYQFAVEITDEKYAKYFEEHKGKKYLVLMSEAFYECKPDTYFFEHICDEYSVETLLDWQEGLVELRCFMDGHYKRKGNEEDENVIKRMDEETRKIRNKYKVQIDELKEQIASLEMQMVAETDRAEKEFYNKLPKATPEFDSEGLEKTKNMLAKIGKDLCDEMFSE